MSTPTVAVEAPGREAEPEPRPPRRRGTARALLVALPVLVWTVIALRVAMNRNNPSGRQLLHDMVTNLPKVLTGPPRNVGDLLVCALFLGAGALPAAALLRVLRFPLTSLAEEMLLALCLGQVILTPFVMVVGTGIGLGTPVLVTSLCLLALAGLGGLLVTKAPYSRRPGRPRFRRPRWTHAGLVAIIAGLLVIPFVGVLSPEVNWDAKWYHLGPAQHFVAAGRFYDALARTGMWTSALGSYEEMLYTGLYGLGGMVAAKVLAFAQLVLVVALLWQTGRRFFGSTTVGLMAGVGFLSIPVVTWSGTTAYNDLPIALATLAMFYCALASRESGAWQWAALAGAFGGWALGVKQFGAISVGVIVVVALAWPRRWDKAHLLRSLRVATITGLGVVVAWAAALIRSYELSGNPVYPLFYKLFPSPYWNDAKQAAFQSGLDPVPWTRVPIDLVRLPYDLVVAASKHNTLTGPMLLLVLPALALAALVFGRRHVRHLGVTAAVSVLWVIGWMRAGAVDYRYLMGAWPIALLGLAAFAVSIEWRRGHMIGVGACLLAAFAGVAAGSPFGATIEKDSDPVRGAMTIPVFWDYVYGNEPARNVQLQYYPTVEWLNANVPRTEKIYDADLLHIHYVYLQPEIFTGSPQDGPTDLRIWSLCNQDAPWRLRDTGITYVAARALEYARLSTAPVFAYLEPLYTSPDGLDTVYRFHRELVGPEPSNVSHAFCPYWGY